jgi:Zn-dependent metalloprotease
VYPSCRRIFYMTRIAHFNMRRTQIKLLITAYSMLSVFFVGVMVSGCAANASRPKEVSLPTPSEVSDSDSMLVAKAIAYLQSRRSKYGISNAESEFVFQNDTVDKQNRHHIRFQQVHRGVPVFGHQLIVHFSDPTEPNGISGTYRSIRSNLQIEPVLRPNDASTNALITKGEGWTAISVEKNIYVAALRPSLAYLVTIERNGERMLVLIDAEDGSLLHEISEVRDVK